MSFTTSFNFCEDLDLNINKIVLACKKDLLRKKIALTIWIVAFFAIVYLLWFFKTELKIDEIRSLITIPTIATTLGALMSWPVWIQVKKSRKKFHKAKELRDIIEKSRVAGYCENDCCLLINEVLNKTL